MAEIGPGVWPLGAAASHILLQGSLRNPGESVKLTLLELSVAGKLRIELPPPRRPLFGIRRRSALDEARAWVPAGVAPPENPTARSLFDAALRSDRSLEDVVFLARYVPGDLRASSLAGWAARYPLKELYDRGLMRTRRRPIIPDVPVRTQEGRAAADLLRERLAALRGMPGLDRAAALGALHLAGTSFLLDPAIWPGIEALFGDLAREERTRAAGGSGGGGGDGGDLEAGGFDQGLLDGFDLDLGGLDFGSLDFGVFDLGGLDFGGGGDGGGGGGGGDGGGS